MYRPYISLDIETAGLGPEVDTLQISMVLDEPGREIEDLKTFDVILKHSKLHKAEPEGLYFNHDLMALMYEGKDNRLQYPGLAIKGMIAKLEDWRQITSKYDEDNNLGMKGKHLIAGKNVGDFDKPKLRWAAENYCNKSILRELDSKWMVRTLDPGSMYWSRFGYNPSLSQINEITGRKEVSHNALDDAFDVVYAIRKYYDLQGELNGTTA